MICTSDLITLTLLDHSRSPKLGKPQDLRKHCARGYSNDRQCILIPNIFKGITGNRKPMSDQIHPNASGYTIMARMFYEAMAPYL